VESMTGFGKTSLEEEGLRVTVMLRGVNHKGLDIRCSMPPSLWHREVALRRRISDAARRGRVEVHVSLEYAGERAVEIRASEGIAHALGG